MHILGMMQAEEVRPEEVTYNRNDEHYTLKARIEGCSGVFVQPERHIVNM